MTKEIEIDLFTTKMTVSQATERGKEFVEAGEISKMINTFIYKQTDYKTSKQTSFILGEVRRFCNVLEHELHEQRKEMLLKNKKQHYDSDTTPE